MRAFRSRVRARAALEVQDRAVWRAVALRSLRARRNIFLPFEIKMETREVRQADRPTWRSAELQVIEHNLRETD